MLTWRDIKLLCVAWSFAFTASGAYAAALLQEPTSLLELPWTAVIGAVGLAMAGGLVSTLSALHKAAEQGLPLNVPLRLAVDLGMALVIGLVTYAAVSYWGWGPYALLGALPVFGFAGARFLDPLINLLIERVEQFARAIGVKPPPNT